MKTRLKEDQRLSKVNHRLVARHQEGEIWADVSPRMHGGDLSFLLFGVFSKHVLADLKDRGYDLDTLRFQIDKTPEAILAYEKKAGRA